MALQASEDMRNAMLSAAATIIGSSPVLKFFDGTLPANVAAADDGVVVATANLPASPFAAPASGSMAKSSDWEDPEADNAGQINYFRFYTSGAVCKLQGTVTLTGGGGDMTIDEDDVAVGQPVIVTSFSLNMPNA